MPRRSDSALSSMARRRALNASVSRRINAGDARASAGNSGLPP